MSNNVVPLESTEKEPVRNDGTVVSNFLSEDVVVAKLMSAGVNQIYRSYDEEQKTVYKRFIESDLSFIAPCWNDLNDHVKIEVITAHQEEFLRFVSGE